MTEQFQHFFRPETRSAAEDLISSKALFLKVGTDTQIEATVRGSMPAYVTFRSVSIESSEFKVDCSCKASAKGRFCKHIWATLVVASERQPDFFAMKISIAKGDVFSERALANSAARSPEALQRQADFKERQATTRKKNYESQKVRAKALKAKREDSRTSASPRISKSTQFLPTAVQDALKYFELNGIALSLPIDDEELGNAKRILARVFHPDKGGTQDEAIELLRHAEVLSKHR